MVVWEFGAERNVMPSAGTVTADVRAPKLLPLPLTVFELLMATDARPSCPMTCLIEMVMVGRLEHELFEAAVQEAVSRHPLLMACVRNLHFRPTWVECHTPAPVIWERESDPPSPPEMPWIDLKHEPGIRIYVREGSDRTSIWLQLHHACGDGRGAQRFLVDLFTAYARQFPDRKPCPEYDALNYDRLLHREARFPPPGAVNERGATFAPGESFAFLTQTPMVLPSGGNTGPYAYPRIARYAFTSEETAAIRARARAEASTINTVGLGLLFGTLADWSLRHGKRGSKYLRVLVPMDLRERVDEYLPFANRMGFTFVTRKLSVCDDWLPLLTGLRDEALFVQKYVPARDFLNNIIVGQRIPFAVWLFQRLPLCFSSAVFTNLGDPTRRFRRRFPDTDGMITIGDAHLELIYGCPPVRPYTAAGFELCRCAQRMTVSAHFDARFFGEADSRQLLDEYLGRWRRWLEATPTPLPSLGPGAQELESD